MKRKQAIAFLKHYEYLNTLYYKSGDILSEDTHDQYFSHLFDHTETMVELIAGRSLTDEEYGQAYTILLNPSHPAARYKALKKLLL